MKSEHTFIFLLSACGCSTKFELEIKLREKINSLIEKEIDTFMYDVEIINVRKDQVSYIIGYKVTAEVRLTPKNGIGNVYREAEERWKIGV